MKDFEGKNRAARPFILHRKQVRWSIVCILLLLFILECCSIFASGRRTLHATQMEWTYSCQRVEGGTVWISSYETEDGYCIEIRDNGVGFSVDQALRQSEGHGLNNIRSRLEYQCGAQLQISTSPGEGCDAKVLLPK